MPLVSSIFTMGGLPLISENGPKKIKTLELSDPIDISSDEKDDLTSGRKDEEMVESFADVELDEPVFHKLASPKKLRKRSSSIRSVTQNDRESNEKDPDESDEDETGTETSQPQRRKSSRVRRSVLPEKKDEPESKPEEPSLPQRPRSRQENGQNVRDRIKFGLFFTEIFKGIFFQNFLHRYSRLAKIDTAKIDTFYEISRNFEKINNTLFGLYKTRILGLRN